MTETWERLLAQGVGQPAELLGLLRLKQAALRWPIDPHSAFKTKVPHDFVAKMQPENPHDPLLLQVLASLKEQEPKSGFSADPLAEQSRLEAPGLIQKYAHRVLLTLTGACAIHCRYCFRRQFPYAAAVPGHHDWQQTYDYINAHKDIEEVILSGGDPLVLKDEKLAAHIKALKPIKHLTTLRIHTRTPVVLPQRVTPKLGAALSHWQKQLVIVIHCNHPAEINDATATALRRLSAMGDALLNQSVLLAGINDDPEVLGQLSKRLLAARTLPYYLHALDRVAGSGHFEVSPKRAQEIMQTLRATLPGYLVPRFVCELPGEASKTPL